MAKQTVVLRSRYSCMVRQMRNDNDGRTRILYDAALQVSIAGQRRRLLALQLLPKLSHNPG